MKKVLFCLLVLLLLTQLFGCVWTGSGVSEDDRINEMSGEIIRCLIEKDRVAMANLFCQQVQNTDEFNAQIDALYAFFDYDFYTRADLNGNHAQSKSKKDGEIEEWSICAEIVYIQVGEEDSFYYGIQYNWTETYLQDPSVVGLHSISVYLLNTDESVMLGTDTYFPF